MADKEKITLDERRQLIKCFRVIESHAAKEPENKNSQEWKAWEKQGIAISRKYHDLLIRIISEVSSQLIANDTSMQSIAKFLKTIIDSDGIVRSGLSNLPTSPVADLLDEVLSYGIDDVVDLPARKKSVSHSANYFVGANTNAICVRKTNEKMDVLVKLTDIEKKIHGNSPAKKLFTLLLIKANEQAVYNGKLTQDYVTFPLQEMVDLGIYKTIRSARTGFNAGADILRSIKIKGHTMQGRNCVRQDGFEVLITGAWIRNGQCYMYLNHRISWGFILQYYTVIPDFYFALPSRAADLLYYIFFLARQKTKDIAEKGYFTISFRAIQMRLKLPYETESKNPQRDIKEVIDTVVTQIEVENGKAFPNREFCMVLKCDELANTAKYINDGYLKVMLRGEFAEKFVPMSESTAKKVEAAQKRKTRIEEKALAINMEKHIRNSEQKDGKK